MPHSFEKIANFIPQVPGLNRFWYWWRDLGNRVLRFQ